MVMKLFFSTQNVMKMMNKWYNTIFYIQNLYFLPFYWKWDFYALQRAQRWMLTWHLIYPNDRCEITCSGELPKNPHFIPHMQPIGKARDLLTTTPLFSSCWNTRFMGTENVSVNWQPRSSRRDGVIMFTIGFLGSALSSL